MDKKSSRKTVHRNLFLLLRLRKNAKHLENSCSNSSALQNRVKRFKRKKDSRKCE
jgi:hypothetical protein